MADAPHILTAVDRQAIRDCWLIDDYDLADVLALLDTCDAMENVIRRLDSGWWADTKTGILSTDLYWFSGHDDPVLVLPAEVAVLDAIREDK